MLDRRNWLRAGFALALVVSGATGCGGGTSRLVTVKRPTGSGDIDLQVENKTDAAVNNLYMAKTEAVNKALAANLEPGSPAEAELWGEDRLGGKALARGTRQRVSVSEPGRWDVRAVDRDGRYQHVAGLRIEAGGKYILELVDGGWRIQK
jgi:hypothetical protein